MLGNKKVSELTDEQLKAVYANCGQVEKKRVEAAKHDKFNKIQFPQINPNFIKLKNDLKSELEKRKLI